MRFCVLVKNVLAFFVVANSSSSKPTLLSHKSVKKSSDLMSDAVADSQPSSPSSSSKKNRENGHSLYSTSNFIVHTDKGEEVLYTDIKESVKHVIKDWDYLDQDVSISSLKGGITNLLYTLTPIHQADKTVIVRVYGEGTSLFVDRALENTVFSTLSELGVGPKFYGTFKNGRVEGFCDAKTLTPSEISDRAVYPKTASAIARLHAQQIQGISHSAALWSKMDFFFDLAEQALREKQTKEDTKFELDDFNQEEMRGEARWLQDNMKALSLVEQKNGGNNFHLKGLLFGLETVLCHNDLLSGNILMSNEKREDEVVGNILMSNDKREDEDETDGIVLIDFEYAMYNYRAWDIANHFNEFAGFDFNIERDFPNKDRRMEFLKCYVNGVAKYGTQECREVLSGIINNPDDLNEFIGGLEVVVCYFALASHLFWGTWAVIQSQISSIDFDFAGYAKLRYQ
eukprot:CAMPEP_0119046476 /NCGR_PEP_ID=MMETSP1177-20130426/46813_1 /TAXON_ID=2985 /ORGANISM="Ochromonas sp, Strain CCMP1899" /LENGTH=455 /DNA_ID=CAMNT_0007019663 /DNA_START=51 /DNA_END=1415 /DNA_ORIENTATION=+